MIDGNLICGHVAQLDHALQAYMAGKVGEVIGLDAEYYFRRCAVKTGRELTKPCKYIKKVFNNMELVLMPCSFFLLLLLALQYEPHTKPRPFKMMRRRGVALFYFLHQSFPYLLVQIFGVYSSVGRALCF